MKTPSAVEVAELVHGPVIATCSGSTPRSAYYTHRDGYRWVVRDETAPAPVEHPRRDA